MAELTIQERITETLSSKTKMAELLARISLFAFIMFAAYGWVSNEPRTIYTGIFFLVCFFGFLYAKRVLSARESSGRTFMGTTVQHYDETEKR